MAKPKVSNSEILTYLQERKKSLKKELEQLEKVLNSIDDDEKPSGKKGKKKGKKKLEKAVKAIRKKVTEAIKGVKADSESTPIESAAATSKPPRSPKTKASVPDTATVQETEERPVSKVRKPRIADKPASASAVTAVPAVVVEEKRPVRKKAAAVRKTEEQKANNESVFNPNATMDEKIRYALGQKGNSTKEELIDHLNGLEPAYGLSKLRKVVAFRLNHLVKTGKIKGKESKSGIRYAN